VRLDPFRERFTACARDLGQRSARRAAAASEVGAVAADFESLLEGCRHPGVGHILKGLGAARRRAHQELPTQIRMGELSLASMLESCNTSSIRTYPSDWSPQLASMSITG